jgi:acetylornithine/succinyldiaminopimelate/putrescine aminotransferase
LPPPQDRRRIPAEHEHIKNITPYPALTGEGRKLLSDEQDFILICDEIGTGFNRTGTLFSILSRAIRPDIVVCGKALTNGLYPLSICFVSSEMLTSIYPEAFASTFGGMPAGCAAALATLAYHKKYELGLSCREKGNLLRKRLCDNLSSCSAFKGVYGDGLELAIHLDWSKVPLEALTPATLLTRLLDKGIFAALSPSDSHIMVMPPLTIGSRAMLTAADLVAETLTV